MHNFIAVCHIVWACFRGPKHFEDAGGCAPLRRDVTDPLEIRIFPHNITVLTLVVLGQRV